MRSVPDDFLALDLPDTVDVVIVGKPINKMHDQRKCDLARDRTVETRMDTVDDETESGSPAMEVGVRPLAACEQHQLERTTYEDSESAVHCRLLREPSGTPSRKRVKPSCLNIFPAVGYRSHVARGVGPETLL